METSKNSMTVILDDDWQARETLTRMIRSWGLNAEGFAQPEHALKHISNTGCDIVLLNIFTSAVSALELIPQFDNDLKIIVMTEPSLRDTAVRTLELGAFSILEKPYEDDLLRHLISSALKVLENERGLKRLKDDFERSRLESHAYRRRLENLNSQLFETNRALSVLTRNIDREREEMETRIALKLKNLLMPILRKLRDDPALYHCEAQIDMLTHHLESLTSAFTIDANIAMTLSSAEMRIASLVKNGVSTDEIARRLHISENTVRTHRRNIRRKLKINARYSLRNFLDSKIALDWAGKSSRMAYTNLPDIAGSYRYN